VALLAGRPMSRQCNPDAGPGQPSRPTGWRSPRAAPRARTAAPGSAAHPVHARGSRGVRTAAITSRCSTTPMCGRHCARGSPSRRTVNLPVQRQTPSADRHRVLLEVASRTLRCSTPGRAKPRTPSLGRTTGRRTTGASAALPTRSLRHPSSRQHRLTRSGVWSAPGRTSPRRATWDLGGGAAGRPVRAGRAASAARSRASGSGR